MLFVEKLRRHPRVSQVSSSWPAEQAGIVGHTDAEIKADDKSVVVLRLQEAKKLVEKYASSYPKPKKLPPLVLPDFLNVDAGKR
jgi:hypothetical protein